MKCVYRVYRLESPGDAEIYGNGKNTGAKRGHPATQHSTQATPPSHGRMDRGRVDGVMAGWLVWVGFRNGRIPFGE